MTPIANSLACVLLTACSAQHVDPAPAGSISPHYAEGSSSEADRELEVWIDLSAPALNTAPADDPEMRAALRDRIVKQQDEVMAQLARLGAEELARVVEVRNAIAVRMPVAHLEQARALQGVVKVRVVKHRRRMP